MSQQIFYLQTGIFISNVLQKKYFKKMEQTTSKSAATVINITYLLTFIQEENQEGQNWIEWVMTNISFFVNFANTFFFSLVIRWVHCVAEQCKSTAHCYFPLMFQLCLCCCRCCCSSCICSCGICRSTFECTCCPTEKSSMREVCYSSSFLF